MRFLIFFICLLACLFACMIGHSQSVVDIHFGEGDNNPFTVGPPLPRGSTYFKYSKEVCPPPGHYTVIRRTNVLGCFNDSWNDISKNNTPGRDLGFMMVVNDSATSGPRVVYLDTVETKILCPGTSYKFSAAFINVDKPSNCYSYFPSFTLSIETLSGQVLASGLTGNISYATGLKPYSFQLFGTSWLADNATEKIILRITSDTYNTNGSDCGDDFAIDDIRFEALGPEPTVAFNQQPDGFWAHNACYKNNIPVVFTCAGSAGAVQWQESNDDGRTWKDIPGARDTLLSRVFSTPGYFNIRARTSEAPKIENPYCSSVSGSLLVRVDGPPYHYNITSNSPICSGQPLIFNADRMETYIWTGPNGFYDDVSYASIYNTSLKDSGMYYLHMVSQGGCKEIDSVHVVILGTDVHAGPDTAICIGASVRLQGTKGKQYHWYPAEGLSNASIQMPLATPKTTTSYIFQLEDGSGCSDTAIVTIKVVNTIPVQALFSAPEALCRPQDTALFFDKSIGVINNWHWDFNNGQNSNSKDPPVQNFVTNGNNTGYRVHLTVKDTAGCTDSTSQVIKFADNCYIAVPTAFTPNGDGLNDYLYPLNTYKASKILFRVYDRNGQLVFETTDRSKKWDGTYRGVPQGTSTYVWTFNYSINGNSYFLKGTTVLIR